MAEDPLVTARQALDRGDYGDVLRLLEPLARDQPPTNRQGADLRLLMATALMGQGQIERAASCCRSLQGCSDSTRRAQARDLLLVLEAPALRRPRNWSLTMPALPEIEPFEGKGVATARRTPRPAPDAPPPVGPTSPPLGFALVVVVILLGLAFLLGGCMEVRTDLHFQGPGRIQLSHHLHSTSGQALPWQRRFSTVLESRGFQRDIRLEQAVDSLQSPVLPTADGLESLGRSLETAAELTGLSIPAPRMEIEERNWLVGVRQHLTLEIDLTPLGPMPLGTLTLGIGPMRSAAVRQAEPNAVRSPPSESGPFPPPGRGMLLWPLENGQVNRIDIRCWHWSGLGLGSLLILAALVLVLCLQTIRRGLGYGWPELPA